MYDQGDLHVLQKSGHSEGLQFNESMPTNEGETSEDLNHWQNDQPEISSNELAKNHQTYQNNNTETSLYDKSERRCDIIQSEALLQPNKEKLSQQYGSVETSCDEQATRQFQRLDNNTQREHTDINEFINFDGQFQVNTNEKDVKTYTYAANYQPGEVVHGNFEQQEETQHSDPSNEYQTDEQPYQYIQLPSQHDYLESNQQIYVYDSQPYEVINTKQHEKVHNNLYPLHSNSHDHLLFNSEPGKNPQQQQQRGLHFNQFKGNPDYQAEQQLQTVNSVIQHFRHETEDDQTEVLQHYRGNDRKMINLNQYVSAPLENYESNIQMSDEDDFIQRTQTQVLHHQSTNGYQNNKEYKFPPVSIFRKKPPPVSQFRLPVTYPNDYMASEIPLSARTELNNNIITSTGNINLMNIIQPSQHTASNDVQDMYFEQRSNHTSSITDMNQLAETCISNHTVPIHYDHVAGQGNNVVNHHSDSRSRPYSEFNANTEQQYVLQQSNHHVGVPRNVIKALGNNRLGVVGKDGEIMIIGKNSSSSSSNNINSNKNVVSGSTSYILQQQQRPRAHHPESFHYQHEESVGGNAIGNNTTTMVIENQQLFQPEYIDSPQSNEQFVYDHQNTDMEPQQVMYDENGFPSVYVNNGSGAPLMYHNENVDGNFNNNQGRYELYDDAEFIEDRDFVVQQNDFTGQYNIQNNNVQLPPSVELKGINVVPNQGEKIILSSSNKGKRIIVSSQVVPTSSVSQQGGYTVDTRYVDPNQATLIHHEDGTFSPHQLSNVSFAGIASPQNILPHMSPVDDNQGNKVYPYRILRDESVGQMGKKQIHRYYPVNRNNNSNYLIQTPFNTVMKPGRSRVKVAPSSPKTLLANAEKEHAFILEYQKRTRRRGNKQILKKELELYGAEIKQVNTLNSQAPVEQTVGQSKECATAVVHLTINNAPNSTTDNPEKVINCDIKIPEVNKDNSTNCTVKDNNGESVVQGVHEYNIVIPKELPLNPKDDLNDDNIPLRRRRSKYEYLAKRLSRNLDVGDVLGIQTYKKGEQNNGQDKEDNEEDCESDDSEKYRFEDEEYVTSFIKTFQTNPRRYKIYPEASQFKKAKIHLPKIEIGQKLVRKKQQKVDQNMTKLEEGEEENELDLPGFIIPQNKEGESQDQATEGNGELDVSFGDPNQLLQNINKFGKELLQTNKPSVKPPRKRRNLWEKFGHPPLCQQKNLFQKRDTAEGQVDKLLAYINELSGEVQKMAAKPNGDNSGIYSPDKKPKVEKKIRKMKPYYTHKSRQKPLDLSKKPKYRRRYSKQTSDSNTSLSSAATPRTSIDGSSSANASKITPRLSIGESSSANTSKITPRLNIEKSSFINTSKITPRSSTGESSSGNLSKTTLGLNTGGSSLGYTSKITPPRDSDSHEDNIKQMARMAKEVLNFAKLSKISNIGGKSKRRKAKIETDSGDATQSSPEFREVKVKKPRKKKKKNQIKSTIKRKTRAPKIQQEEPKKPLLRRSVRNKDKDSEKNVQKTRRKNVKIKDEKGDNNETPEPAQKKSKRGRPKKKLQVSFVKQNVPCNSPNNSPLDLSIGKKRRHFLLDIDDENDKEIEMLTSQEYNRRYQDKLQAAAKKFNCLSDTSINAKREGTVDIMPSPSPPLCKLTPTEFLNTTNDC